MGNSGSRKKKKNRKDEKKNILTETEGEHENLQSENIDNAKKEMTHLNRLRIDINQDNASQSEDIDTDNNSTKVNKEDNFSVSPEDITLEDSRESNGNFLSGSLKCQQKNEEPSDAESEITEERCPLVMTVKQDKVFVAAIDFGTTHSGFAYCIRESKSKIYTPSWLSCGHRTDKAPTCVLLKPDRSLHSFGYEAEEDFHNRHNNEDFQSWYFFKNFKMLLYESKDMINAETVIKDVMASPDKEEMKAVDLFAIVINYFRKELLQTVRKSYGASTSNSVITDNDMHWVLTVPGIWDVKAKHFMREAALQAGILNDQLSLALEPEAASLYCRNLPMFVEEGQDKGKVIAELPIGSKYIVLDQGGGTIDLTIHEVESETTLKEIHQASGGSWGSNRINKNFEAFLVDLFGRNVIDQAIKEDPTDYQEFLSTFELKKISFKHKKDNKFVTFKVPFIFLEQYESINQVKFQNGDWTQRYGDQVSFLRDKLSIESTLFMAWYEDTVSCIVNFMREIFAKKHLRNIDIVLAVGGFSKSEILMDKLKEEFPHINIIIPEDADLSVLKGAILYAFDPKCITCRVAQCTYGLSMQMPYDPMLYKDRKKIVGVNKRFMVDDVFDKHIEVGQVLYHDDVPKEHEYFPTVENHTSITLEFYASSDKDPKYTNDESCTFLGVLHFDLITRSRIFVRINASGTELVAIARDENTNDEFKGYFSLI